MLFLVEVFLDSFFFEASSVLRVDGTRGIMLLKAFLNVFYFTLFLGVQPELVPFLNLNSPKNVPSLLK